jgi:predicted GH43/DUF377 family glycosyl hydrolase
MHWEKLGQIFDPSAHGLELGFTSYAQAPQTLVFDDFLRIYFSTRSQDVSTGLYRSHIAYIEMDLDFKKILNISNHEVIPLGKVGCFDEHGIFPLHIFQNKEKILGYIGGVSRRQSVPVDSAIGLAISQDQGKTFTRMGDGPILAASLHEPCLIADPFVQFFNDRYYMWYIFGQGWGSFGDPENSRQERIYKITQASSIDGIHWDRQQGRSIIASKIGEYECQALPTVIKIEDQYHMFFCYRFPDDFRTNRERSYRIGYAFSDDLINWTRKDEEVGIKLSEHGWDSEMNCYPHVFYVKGQIFMLYNGNEFGKNGFGLAKLNF